MHMPTNISLLSMCQTAQLIIVACFLHNTVALLCSVTVFDELEGVRVFLTYA